MTEADRVRPGTNSLMSYTMPRSTAKPCAAGENGPNWRLSKVLLWPSNKDSAKEFYHGTAPSKTSYSKPAINEALNHATDVFLSRGTNVKLTLPYTPVGNKQQFIDNVLNK
jgi:hypothetical protein